MSRFFEPVFEFLQNPLFTLGKTPITLALLLYLFVSVGLLFWVSGKMKRLLQNRLLARYNMDVGVRQAISTIARYLVVTVGFMIIIQNTALFLRICWGIKQ